MHEIGVLMEVVKSVERYAAENEVESIVTLVLQIGELSSMMKPLSPAAVEGTILDGSELDIEILPANGLCKSCNKVFKFLEYEGRCPICNGRNIEVLSGKEFFIKEIVCY